MCVCVAAAGNLITALMYKREEEGGSGEEEKCRVAVLVFPCDEERTAWAFQTSGVTRQREVGCSRAGRACAGYRGPTSASARL